MKLQIVCALTMVWLGTMAVFAQDCTGRCVPRNNCLLDDEELLPSVNLRFGLVDSEVKGSCPNSLHICCPSDKVEEEPTSTHQQDCTGRCVPRNNCLLDDEESLPSVNLRFGLVDSEVKGSCPNSLHICCPSDKVEEEPTSTHQQDCTGRCVPRNNCLLDDEESLPSVNLRFGLVDSEVKGSCPNSLHICCPPDKVEEEPTSTHQQDCTGRCVPRNNCLLDDEESLPSVNLRFGLVDSEVKGSCPNSFHICCPPDKVEEEPTSTHQQDCTGRCVPRNNCLLDDDGSLPVVDLRIGQDDSEVFGSCSHYLEVCCPLDALVAVPSPTQKKTQEENFQTCGQSNPSGVGFRIGAGKIDEAEFGEFPWTMLVLEMMEVYSGRPKREVYACVGSLLAPNVVLTVAHCVFNRTATNLVVRAGEWDTNTVAELLPYQDAPVRFVLVHERYNEQLHFDVALLVLAQPFRPAENVQTVCLPPPGLRPEMDEECITGGWGKDRFGKEGVYQHILKRVSLPIVEKDKCQQALRTARPGPKFELHSTFMCAGGRTDAHVCSGDGGAALACLMPGTDKTYYQAGIVAWGIGCGYGNIPGVYVDISEVRPWIVDNLKALNVDPAFYTDA